MLLFVESSTSWSWTSWRWKSCSIKKDAALLQELEGLDLDDPELLEGPKLQELEPEELELEELEPDELELEGL